jgi:hypothetical protein
MVCGLGEYAVVVSANAPATIETDGPPGDVFDVDGAVEFELLLQPMVSVTTSATKIRRRVIYNFLLIFRRITVQTRCRRHRVARPTFCGADN